MFWSLCLFCTEGQEAKATPQGAFQQKRCINTTSTEIESKKCFFCKPWGKKGSGDHVGQETPDKKHRNYWPIINSLQARNYLYPLDEKQQLCCYHDTWIYSKTRYILVENVTALTLYQVINKELITKVSIKPVVSKGSNFQVEWTSIHQCTMQDGWCLDRKHFFIVCLSHW